MATIKVDKGNHPRRGSITKYPEEIDQVFLDIRTWYDENAKDIVRRIIIIFPRSNTEVRNHALNTRTFTGCRRCVSKTHGTFQRCI